MVKRKERKDASIVFAEIEAKLPEDLVLHEEHKEGRTYASNKYYSNYLPHWVKKQTRIRKKGNVQAYSIVDALTLFLGLNTKTNEDCPPKAVFSAFSLEGFLTTKVVENGSDFDVEVEVDDTNHISFTAKNENKIQEMDVIGLAKAFTKYAGITPTVYFKYLNYKQHIIFRKEEDTAFILKYCLDYYSGFCMDKRSHIYYRNRDFLLSIAEKYPTLVSILLNRQSNKDDLEDFTQRLIACGYAENTQHRNKILSYKVNRRHTEAELKITNKLPTTVLQKLSEYSVNNQHLNLLLAHINHTKTKMVYKYMDTDVILDNYSRLLMDIIDLFCIKTITSNGKRGFAGWRSYKFGMLTSHIDKIVLDSNVLDYLAVVHNTNKDILVEYFTQIPYIVIHETCQQQFETYIITVRVELDI